eukprot:TRINITY_DN1289_c0_g1_i4.p1 TRINITY_DN1289_c0_g1~~TRINITY_DN1289_c0_g1_i4.p1  ORF type:complete len:174 (-),score=88.56 TRINITY_DN1289_c0_g1_i4:143-664(-)
MCIRDSFNGAEFISDAYPAEDDTPESWGGVYMKIKGTYIQVGEDDVVLDGANASEEEVVEDADTTTETKIDLVHHFKLENIELSKADFKEYIMGFSKRIVKAKKEAGVAQEEIKAFKTGIQAAAGDILKNFNDYSYYCTDEYDMEGSLALCTYGAGGEPYLYYLLDGFKHTKI